MLKPKIYIITFLLLINAFAFGNLIRPENGDELNYIHVLFEWEQETDVIEYNLQVSTQQFFNNLLLDIYEATNVFIDKDNFNWDDTYYWKVRPVYANGDFGEWSEISNFSIGDKQFPERDADIYDDDLLQDGLVAFGGFAPEFSSAVIDKYGNEIWNTGDEGSFDFMINHIN